MKPIERLPEARRDIDEAVDWYDKEQPGVSDRFLDEIEAAYSKIQRSPSAWPIRRKKARKCSLVKFPFNVIYVEHSDKIWIVAIAHAKRRPNYWFKRMKNIP
ncbi:MAG TPA: type II toxin-antitoxin system RelE/ParE family toxin [Planctomycetota bacterium]|nr:type II toxin-antitoxin system RelE/ParE family toxin [Planctomycetota bacterium]